MEDNMMDMAEMVFDEKVSTKRVREEEDNKKDYVGRLEKRPSGILVKEEEENKNGFLNQFLSSLVSPRASELDLDVEVEEKNDDLGGNEDGIGGGDGGNGGGEGAGGGGSGIINNLISNIFHHNDLGDGGDDIGGGDGGNGGGGEEEKEGIEKDGGGNDIVSDMPDKKPPSGCKNMIRPDDYSERVFFLNNN